MHVSSSHTTQKGENLLPQVIGVALADYDLIRWVHSVGGGVPVTNVDLHVSALLHLLWACGEGGWGDGGKRRRRRRQEMMWVRSKEVWYGIQINGFQDKVLKHNSVCICVCVCVYVCVCVCDL